jgi:hypothetical protein
MNGNRANGLHPGNHRSLQEEAMTSTTTRISQIANVCIPVADVDRAVAFYTGPLVLEKRTDVPFEEMYRRVEVAPPGATS